MDIINNIRVGHILKAETYVSLLETSFNQPHERLVFLRFNKGDTIIITNIKLQHGSSPVYIYIIDFMFKSKIHKTSASNLKGWKIVE